MCMLVCMYAYVFISLYISVHTTHQINYSEGSTYVYMHTYVHTFIHTHTRNISLAISAALQTSITPSEHINACMYVYTCAHMHTHIYTHKHVPSSLQQWALPCKLQSRLVNIYMRARMCIRAPYKHIYTQTRTFVSPAIGAALQTFFARSVLIIELLPTLLQL
jgi:hypothetical protein